MHDEERRFGCDLCSKRFRQKTSLLMHLKVHKDARDYICTSCGKGQFSVGVHHLLIL